MKTVYKIGMLAVAALAFVGCSKEINDPTEQKVGTHTLTFTVQKDIDTKTAVVQGDGVASYVWTEGDDAYLHVYENGIEATSKTVSFSSDYKIATIKATFANTDTTAFSYRATYGSDLAQKKPHNPLIPAKQAPRLNSFDPAADVLVSAEDITLENLAAADENTEFLFRLQRVVSANKMTLKGLTEGETIKSVVLRSSDKYFSARYLINDGTYSNENRDLTFDYTKLENAVVGSDGTFPVYFTSAPVTDASFSIVVTTDQHIYTRDDFTSKLTLAVGTFRRFGINLADYGEVISTGTKYTLVTKQTDLYNGATYILVGGETFAMGEQKTANRAAVAVTATDGIINIDNTINAYPVVIEEVEDGYTIFDVINKGYLCASGGSSSNQLTIKDAAEGNAVWSISIENSVAAISNVVNTTRGQMRFNPNNGNPLFACYATSGTAGTPNLALYVDKSTCVAHPSILVTPTAISDVSYQGIEAASDLTFELKDLEGTVEVTCDETVVTEAVAVDNTIVYSVSANTGNAREGWIEIAIGEVSVRVTVNQSAAPTPDFTTVAQLIALAETDEATKTGTLTGAVISFVPDSQNAVIKDETGSILFYAGKDNTHSYKQGQTFTGELTVNIKLYNGCAELTACDATFVGEETTVAPATVTLAQLEGNLSTYQNAYVQVAGLAVTDVNGRNLSVEDGNNSYVVYVPADCTIIAGDIITVTGTVAHFGSNDQIKVWSLGAITKTSHETVISAVTIIAPSQAGCSIKVKVNGSEIADGTTVTEGTEVALEATAGDGFTFNSWSVKKTSNANISVDVEDGVFEMPTYPVTISASFTSTTGEDKTYTITWNSTNNSAGVSSYTASWSVTADGLTLNMANWNNNNNGWSYVKAGRKNSTSVATITTSKAIPEAIKTVKLTIDSVTAAKINSLKVYVSSSSDFANATSYSFTVETGEKSVTLSNPSTSCYYKIEADCAAGSSNGLIQVSKLVFTTE